MSTRSELVAGVFPWARVARTVVDLARAWQRRRMVGRLGALDDRLLADMGITRYDVTSVLAESLFIDPSEKLAERARETRRARSASARDSLTNFHGGEPHHRHAA